MMTAALSAKREEACRAYFEVFLPGLKGVLLVPGLHSLNCVLGVSLVDVEKAAWTLTVADGRLICLSSGADEAPCVFHLDASTLLEVATGILAPDKAFFDLRIEIEGDMALGLQLSTVLAPFFNGYPFHWPGK
tara:strand:+ start:270 stop:668 length:399 start_codon:yes stop_codon:yes gene_type:complete